MTPELPEKDILDFEGNWDRSLPKVDWSYLQSWVSKLGLEPELREVRQEYERA